MTEPKAETNVRWYLNRIRNVVNYEGISGFILRATAFFGYKCGIWLVGWYVKPIADDVESMELQLPIEVIELSLSDVDDYTACNRVMTPDVFQERITTGDRCYAVRHDNKIVSATWVATDHAWIDFISRDMSLRKSEIYIYDSYTNPLCRGQHIQRKMLAEILTRYQATGYKQVCVIIAPENRANIRSRKRSGFKRTAWIVAIKIGRFHWDSFKGH